MARLRPVAVAFGAPVEDVFDLLTDPVRRPEWQRSLRAVEIVDPGPPHRGQRWVDVTVSGIRPRMETVDLVRPHHWTERGRWRGFEVVGQLTFEVDGPGTRVTAGGRVRGAGVRRLLLGPIAALAARSVRADLARAATLLTDQVTGQ